MKNNNLYTLFIFICALNFTAQTNQFNISKASSVLFQGHLYTFGLREQKQKTVFTIFKSDFSLIVKDSLITDLGKSRVDDYLLLYADTLHNYLNIYVQQKEKKEVTILRFNKNFELTSTIEHVDIARLNNTAMFSSNAIFDNKSVYALKIEKDTSGKQFYLNKYELKSELTNFDYEFKWQFPFERKNVHSAHIFFANSVYVLLYVNVSGGSKKGQWILKINADNGKLIRGSKLNDKGDASNYQFGNFTLDRTKKSLYVCGQKFTEAQFNQNENKLVISNALNVSIYVIEIDSLGEVIQKQDFKIPINDVKTGLKKTANSYLLRINNFTKKSGGGFSFETDIFKSIGNPLCYFYSNTIVFNLLPLEEKLVLEKNSVCPNLLIEQFYLNKDKLDMNGKLCIDSLNEFQTLFYRTLTFPVKKQFKIDAEKNPVWILSKTTLKKNGINYTFLNPIKKIYQLVFIEEVVESQNPLFINLSSNSFIISSTPTEGKYELKLFNW